MPQSDDYVNQIKSEYDFVLALSITKWIHLNNGDEGIKRFFKKIYLNLTVNGALLLEPQSWVSYKKKAKLNVRFLLISFFFPERLIISFNFRKIRGKTIIK